MGSSPSPCQKLRAGENTLGLGHLGLSCGCRIFPFRLSLVFLTMTVLLADDIGTPLGADPNLVPAVGLDVEAVSDRERLPCRTRVVRICDCQSTAQDEVRREAMVGVGTIMSVPVFPRM